MKRKKRKKLAWKKVLITILSILFVVFIAFFFKFNRDNKSTDELELVEEETPKINIIDLDSKSRPYAVMINNISTVWGYQSGLQEAYLMYEIIVEGGYTRLMPVFKDKNIERLGSVRSSRHYFLDYALENDAVYVHFGWSPQAQADIGTLHVDNINFLSYSGYTRDKSLGLATEHTAFTTTDNIKAGMEYYNYRTESSQPSLLQYSSEEIDLSEKDGSIKADNVFIGYSNSRNTSFQYDEQNKTYLRFQNGIAHKDYVTGNQYTAKNIIVYQVSNYTIAGDDKNRQNINNIGSGEGYYITDGYAVPITWEKETRTSQTVYKYLNGDEIIVNDGNTHIQIAPQGQILTIE